MMTARGGMLSMAALAARIARLCAGMVLLGLLAATSSAQAATAVNLPTSPRVVPMSAAERANLRLTLDWWREVIEAGHLELVPKYQAESYIQHNPNISTGRDGFLAALARNNSPVNPIPSRLKDPPAIAGARGDYVWMMFEKRLAHGSSDRAASEEIPSGDGLAHGSDGWSRGSAGLARGSDGLASGSAGLASGSAGLADGPAGGASSDTTPVYYQDQFELLRLQGGKVQEHWDAEPKLPGSGVVRPGVSPKPPARFNTGKLTKAELAAREIAVRVGSEIYLQGRVDLAPELIAPDYIEHDPNLQHGVSVTERLEAFVPPQLLLSFDPTVVLVNGEHVLMMWTLFSPDPDNNKQAYRRNYFQLVRVREGKVVEHWDQDAYRDSGAR